MPVPLFGRAPDHVARTYLALRAALALHPAAARGDDQSLPEWMAVPRGPGPRLEGDERAAHAGRVGRLRQRVAAHAAREELLRPLLGRLRAVLPDFHVPY